MEKSELPPEEVKKVRTALDTSLGQLKKARENHDGIKRVLAESLREQVLPYSIYLKRRLAGDPQANLYKVEDERSILEQKFHDLAFNDFLYLV